MRSKVVVGAFAVVAFTVAIYFAFQLGTTLVVPRFDLGVTPVTLAAKGGTSVVLQRSSVLTAGQGGVVTFKYLGSASLGGTCDLTSASNEVIVTPTSRQFSCAGKTDLWVRVLGPLRSGIVDQLKVIRSKRVVISFELPLLADAALSNSASSPRVVGSYTTKSWAGFSAMSSKVTSVFGSWRVPAVFCDTEKDGLVQWAGLNGLSNHQVEQAGTSSECLKGVPTYSSWVELFGDAALNGGNEVVLPIRNYPTLPGNLVTTVVGAPAGPGERWIIEIVNRSEHWSLIFTKPASVGPAVSTSAEWVIERPEVCSAPCHALLALALFHQATFSDIEALDSGDVDLANAQVNRVLMRPAPGDLVAEPSAKVSHGSFSVSLGR